MNSKNSFRPNGKDQTNRALCYERLEVRNLLASVQGDFNNDGFEDLAIGVPRESVGSIENAGAVSVVYGSPTGLTTAADQIWTQNSPGIANLSETGDLFGSSLAIADLDDDGFNDLVIGVPGEGFTGVGPGAGAINVIFGSASGLTSVGNQTFSQAGSVADIPESGDAFGSALAVGDFNNDGFVDVAVGVPGESVGAKTKVGMVNVIYSSASGLTATGNQFFRQSLPGMTEFMGSGDQFGFSLATGDFDNDGASDLVVGVPMDRVQNKAQAGLIHVFHGTNGAGLSTTGYETWHRGTPGIVDGNQPMDRFGFSLAVGDFDGSGTDDIAVGVPFDNFSTWDVGAVNVIYSNASGLNSANNRRWFQSTGGMLDASETRDMFGFSLTANDFDGDGRTDLAIGVPGEDIGANIDTGAVQVMYGIQGFGLRPLGNQFWHEGSAGIDFSAEGFDRYGSSLSSGDFNGDGEADLAIGVPMRDVGGQRNAGAVGLLYGAPGPGLSATTVPDQVWTQNTAGVIDESFAGERFGTFGDTTVFSEFDIVVEFTDNNMSDQQKEAFVEATERWSEIIIGDLPDIQNATGIGFVDDVHITASAPSIDGVNGIVGSAGPLSIRPGSLLPYSGQMEFDIADINNLESTGRWLGTVLHEMGHVLGIGTLWPLFGLLEDGGTSDPRFTGASATAEYNQIFSNSESDIPAANTGGGGTADSHWRESIFQDELMTGYLESAGVAIPISRVTTGSMQDLGYFVDLDGADPYVAPAGGFLRQSPRRPSAVGFNSNSFFASVSSSLAVVGLNSVSELDLADERNRLTFQNQHPIADGGLTSVSNLASAIETQVIDLGLEENKTTQSKDGLVDEFFAVEVLPITQFV